MWLGEAEQTYNIVNLRERESRWVFWVCIFVSDTNAFVPKICYKL